MKCHYCGYARKFTQICSSCGSTMLIPKGASTEQVEEELIKIFPKAFIKRMDSDTLRSKNQYHQILKDFYDKKIDIPCRDTDYFEGFGFP